MNNFKIFGHKSPDTDSVVSAIAMSNLQRKLGNEAEAFCLGNLNKETKFVLNSAKIEEPKLLEKVEENDLVILVDHNEFNQSVEGIKKAKIYMVVDHHRVYTFETAEPLYYRAEPVGCASTIICKLYKENNIEIDQQYALLMLSAIISDTLLFKSPTCTEEDKNIALELAQIAQLDLEIYGLEMLKSGTDLSDLTVKELMQIDTKELMLNDVKAEIAQVNTASISDMMTRKEELENEIKTIIENKDLDIFVFVITDIINSNSQLIVIGNRSDIVEKSYNVKLENNTVFLEGVVSRKKQIVPVMTKNA